MNNSKVKSHVDKLEKKHELLDHTLNSMYKTHASDEQIHEVKKQKLKVKDELEHHKRNL